MERIAEKFKNSVKVYHNILTKREIEYLTLLALGCENLEIAANLVVSRSTVKKTLENIFRKLRLGIGHTLYLKLLLWAF